MNKKAAHRAIPAYELRIGHQIAFDDKGFVEVTSVKHLSDWEPVSGNRRKKVRFEIRGTMSEVQATMIIIVKS